MLIEENTLNHWIDHFYGYGSWDARIWFVSHEEGGGDLPEEVGEKLNYLYTHYPATDSLLCDIRKFYRHLSVPDGPHAAMFSNLYEFRFGNNAKQNSVWKNLIAFVHGYRNEQLPDLLDYQRNVLALSAAHGEALIRLYPLPSPHSHAWYYSWLNLPQHSFLKSRALYEAHVYQKRIDTIVHRIATHRPEVVVMYGMTNINALKKSIQVFFSAAKFKIAKAIKHQIPQHHCATLGDTTMVITTQIPALRHNRIETGFDWQAFGETVRSGKAD